MRQAGTAALLAAVALALAGGALAKIPAPYKNCTQLNHRYPHGIGKVGARDHTTSGAKPVTTFKRSNKLYATAMSHNRGLDRDHDGVACEQA